MLVVTANAPPSRSICPRAPPSSGGIGGSHAYEREGKGGVGVVIAIIINTASWQQQKKARAICDSSLPPAGGSAETLRPEYNALSFFSGTEESEEDSIQQVPLLLLL